MIAAIGQPSEPDALPSPRTTDPDTLSQHLLNCEANLSTGLEDAYATQEKLKDEIAEH